MSNQSRTYSATGEIKTKKKFIVGEDKKVMRISFGGGGSTHKGFTTAKYTTKVKEIQDAIEASTEFKSGKITLVDKNKKKAIPKNEGPTLETVPGIKSIPKAIEYLKGKGFDTEGVNNKLSVIKAATAANIHFSELT